MSCTHHNRKYGVAEFLERMARAAASNRMLAAAGAGCGTTGGAGTRRPSGSASASRAPLTGRPGFLARAGSVHGGRCLVAAGCTTSRAGTGGPAPTWSGRAGREGHSALRVRWLSGAWRARRASCWRWSRSARRTACRTRSAAQWEWGARVHRGGRGALAAQEPRVPEHGRPAHPARGARPLLHDGAKDGQRRGRDHRARRGIQGPCVDGNNGVEARQRGSHRGDRAKEGRLRAKGHAAEGQVCGVRRKRALGGRGVARHAVGDRVVVPRAGEARIRTVTRPRGPRPLHGVLAAHAQSVCRRYGHGGAGRRRVSNGDQEGAHNAQRVLRRGRGHG